MIVGVELRLPYFMSSVLSTVSTSKTNIISFEFRDSSRATLCLRTHMGQAGAGQTYQKFENAGLTLKDFASCA
jgi:hypothetical protein